MDLTMNKISAHRFLPIAPEGRIIVGSVLAITVLATIVWGASAWFFWIVAILITQFFRDPPRDICVESDEIVAPADGRVVFIGRAPSPLDESPKLKISIFMNVFNVHVNRSPVAGTVLQSQRMSGGFFNAALDKASDKNERHLIAIDSAHGEIICVQVAGFLARRVLCHTHVDALLTGGERYGFIRFGSRADLYLPADMKPAIALGDSVVAGVTRVAVP